MPAVLATGPTVMQKLKSKIKKQYVNFIEKFHIKGYAVSAVSTNLNGTKL